MTMENNPVWIKSINIFLIKVSAIEVTDVLEEKMGVERLPKSRETP
jgi:hypothetical protein